MSGQFPRCHLNFNVVLSGHVRKVVLHTAQCAVQLETFLYNLSILHKVQVKLQKDLINA